MCVEGNTENYYRKKRKKNQYGLTRVPPTVPYNNDEERYEAFNCKTTYSVLYLFFLKFTL